MTPQTIFIRSTGTESQHTLQQRLPSVWHNAPLTVHLALAGPDDTSDSIPTGANYYLSILATDANKLPTGTALIAATTSLETGSATNSRGPHAIWDLGVGDMSLIEEPGDYWLLLEVGIGGGDRVVRAAGRLTIKASGLQSSPASPTDPNDVFLTTLDMSEGGNGVADDGKVSAFAADGSLTATVSVGVVGGSGRANFKATNVTATRNLEAPDSSGTLATQEWTTTTLGSYALSTTLRGKAWVPGYSYTLGDIVSYDEDAYVATSTHTASGANRPDQVSAPWERLVTETLLTSELAGKADLAGATFTGPVIFNDTISQSGWGGNEVLATDSEGNAVTTGITMPGGSGTMATVEYADARFRGKAWAEGVSYTDGDVVTYDDVVYTATSTHTSTALNGPGAGLGAPWEGMVSTTNLTTTLSSYALSTAVRGKAWAEGVSYTDGDVVTYGDVVYAATSTHTSTALNGPANGLGAPWEPMASYTNLFGGYSSTTAEAGKLAKHGASGELTGTTVTATSSMVVGQTAGVSGEIQFKDASSSYTVYLQLTDTLTTDVMVQLPVTDGDDVRLATQTWSNTQYTKAPGSTVTDNTLVRFDGTTGKQLQSSQVTLSDTGALHGVTTVRAYDATGTVFEANDGSDSLLLSSGGIAGGVAYGTWNFQSATASRIAGFDASKNLISLDTATYPSLTELGYVKGVTSGIQSQIDSAATLGGAVRTLTATGDTTDRLTAISAAIEAVYAAGGGTVLLGPGLFRVNPTAGGLAILLRTGVRLQGSGPATIIEAGVGAVPFELVAPYGYNTATTVLGANELDICDLTLRSSSLADSNAHGLIGFLHCPRARVRNVTFGDVYHHAVEFNKCRDVLLEDCRFVGQSNSSIVQFDDGGNAGQMSANATAASWHKIEATLRRCHVAARVLTATALSNNARQIELSHSTTVELDRVIFDDCTLGPCLTLTNSMSYTATFNAVPAAVRALEFRNCRILGDTSGLTQGLMLATAGGQVDSLIIEKCFFGAGYDVAGYYCAGGFAYACSPSVARAYSAVSGASGYNLNYNKVRGVRVLHNIFEQRLVQGYCTATMTGTSLMLSLCAIDDAVVAGNVFLGATEASVSTVNVATAIHTFVTAESVRSLSFHDNKLHWRGTPGSGGLPAAGYNVGMVWTQIKMATDSIPCFWSIFRNTVSSDYTAGNICAYTIKEFGTYTARDGWDKGNVILTNATAPSRWTSSSAWGS